MLVSRLRRSALVRRALAAAAVIVAITPGSGPGVAGAAPIDPPPIPIGPNSLGPCPGDPITPTLTVTGAFPASLTGQYVMLPFEVPPGTTQVRVKYCWEGGGNTVDLGLWEAPDGSEPWGPEQFRGWGGSSHPDVSVTPQGFSSEAEYLADPKGHVAGRTTRGFLPGPIPPGTWAAELGVAFVTGDGDAHADFRVEIELSGDESFDDEPYEPAPYDDTPANPAPGWYQGDLHVHAEHSALGDATMTEVFDYAFGPRAEDKAGLDFIALTDYVTPSAWGEIGRYQDDFPGKLILRSAEIITYHGHVNQHGSLRYLDHRIGGEVWQVDPTSGELTLLRGGRDPAELMAEIEAAGGVSQLNHVSLSLGAGVCRGCSWDYTPEETDYSRVDAIELPSGPYVAWAVFGPFAVELWEQQLAAGHRIAAVGVSDSHRAGRTENVQQSPIGDSSTVVYAEELSETGIEDGIRAGHTYAKLFAAGPDLRFSFAGDGGNDGIMGDWVPDATGTLRAEVFPVPEGFGPLTLRLFRNGFVVDELAVPAEGIVQDWNVGAGIYRIDVRDVFIQALTSSIQVPEPGAGAGGLAGLAALVWLRRQRGARG